MSSLIGVDGTNLPKGDITLLRSQVIPHKFLNNITTWDGQEVEEATGNEGATMERWYYFFWLFS
jgi:hypothetical protein